MKKSFPPVRTPIGFLPACIELKGVSMRICVIHFYNGVVRTGYVLEDDSPKAHHMDRVSIASEIHNSLGIKVGVWLDTTVSETLKNYDKGNWKFK